MTVSDEIVAVPSGARFFRADLHIHSFGGSHDVKDATMTPQAIIAAALKEGLRLVAITDHNEITNVPALLEAAKSQDILAIPGVELSTPEGHLLVYFETLEALATYHGKLDLADRGTEKSRCQTSMLECLNRIDASKGFAILAHTDAPGGLEEKVPGFPPHKSDILSAPALLGIELQSANSTISYSPTDPEPQRALIGNARITALKLGQKQFLARVVFSDSHSLAALGKNFQGNRKMTRIKMESPSFNGLRIALEDSDARIRLEDEVPTSVPFLMGIKLEGGFLDGQVVHLSRNLNCIIGGRGAGKSTAFESIRSASTSKSPSKIVDSEIWPEVLHFVWIDEAGQQHTVVRRIKQEPKNLDDPMLGHTAFPMQAYGQNEAAQTSVRAQSDPAALLDYLDNFITFGQLKSEEEGLRTELLESQTNIEKAQIEVAKIPDFKKFLAMTQQQLQAIEKAKATEVVALERKVADERALRSNIERQINDVASQSKHLGVLDSVAAVKKFAPTEPLKVGADEYKQIVALLGQFEGSAQTAQKSISGDAATLVQQVKVHLDAWKQKEQKIVEQIEAKRTELANQGVKLDIAYIRKLAADEATYKKDLATLQLWEPHLVQLRKVRAELLKRRADVRTKIFNARMGYAKKATDSLQGSLGDLVVSLKFSEGGFSPTAETVIQQAMGWRTTQVPKAALIVEQVTVPGLLAAIKKNDPDPLMQVETAEGAKLFNKSEALEIVNLLGQQQVLFQLERCEVSDKPKLIITKTVLDPKTQKTKYVSRDFSRLSLGQQQSILLSLMLLSDSPYPLIIDQPEDNLDSEFIYHSLVPVLRRAKERRQVIIVTHNANIAVLGDAEQIIALKSTSDKSSIVGRGSIDNEPTKRVTCQILEGAEEAFRRRAKIYGL